MAIARVEALVTRLNFLVFRIVPLVSLGMYLILAIFSDSRRREDKGWKRVLVWVAYQLTDWGPSYVIGNLYLETSPHDKITIAFWVPFLLMHHARPDNISAYATEDIKLWVRLIVIEIPLSLGSCFIVCRYILTECTAGWFLRWASGIMLALGFLKHLEGMLALWRSDSGHIRKSGLSNKQSIKLDDYRDQRKLDLEDEEALLIAHDLFEICKGAFCDYKAKMGDRDDKKMDHDAIRSMFTDRWESMCKVVEMELSLMYDILYTKASVVHTWHGYVIRVASPPLTATALLLFILQCKNDMKPMDEIVSYILLCTTFLLDLRWMFRALASAWTHSYFKRVPCSWLRRALWCQGVWEKLRYGGVSLFLSRLSLWLWTCACPKEPKSYRRWAGTFGQRNLLEQCTTGNRHSLYSISRLEIESEDHSRGLEIPDLVKQLVFEIICADLFPPPQIPTYNLQSDAFTDEPPSPPSSFTGGKEGSQGWQNSDDHDCTSTGAHQVLPKPDDDDNTATEGGPNKCPCECPWKPPRCTVHVPHAICNGMGNSPPSWPFCPREPICNNMDNEPPLCPFYPRERICNSMGNETPSWPPYTREQICNGMDSEPPPLPPYPREPICNGMDNECPPWSPYPTQIRARWRNAPFDRKVYDVLVRRHHCPDEEAAMASYGPYEQQSDDHWRYDQAPPRPYEQAYLWRNIHTGSTYDQTTLDNPNKQAAASKPMDESGEFPPELQEAILIWHIATDVFLSCYDDAVPAAPQYHPKTVKAMSDYMVFLLAKRPSMLPGLKLRSMYENARTTLKEIGKVKEKDNPSSSTTKQEKAKELGEWMLKNVDHLKDPSSAIRRELRKDRLKGLDTLLEGTQIARVLLLQIPDWSGIMIEESVRKLAYWIPRLKKRRDDDDVGMLKFIMEAWVHLLMYASIRASREAHAKQLSCGGELTTLVWIITEHAEDKVVRLKCPSFFVEKDVSSK